MALQPDQLGAGRGRQRTRDLGLADTGLTLEQERLLEREREVGGGGESLVGEVTLAGQGPRNILRGLHLPHCDAVVSARRVSTRARCCL